MTIVTIVAMSSSVGVTYRPWHPTMPPPRMVGDSRQPNPLRWGRARDRRRNWQLRAFAAWRWALRWRWHLAWYAAWDQPDAAEEAEVSPSWARFVSRTLEVERLVARVAWCVARIGRELSRPRRALAHV